MESSRQDLSIDMFVDTFNFKNNQITRFPCFTIVFKTDTGLPKTGISFILLVCKDILFILQSELKVGFFIS